MLTCHFCDAELTDSLLQSGRCPNCGGQLRWQDDEDPTLAILRSRELGEWLETEDRTGLAVDAAAAGVRDDQTSDVPEPPAAKQSVAASDAGSDTVDERKTADMPRPPATIPQPGADKQDAMTPEVVARVTAVWSSSLDSLPDALPRHTIKSAEHDDIDEHHLVIQTRRVGGYDRPLNDRSDYELIDVIGEGGVGVVYKARQNSVDRMVAVKMLKPGEDKDEQAPDKFLSEAVVTGELEHPNIVPIYDLGANEDGTLFYSMKRVVGTPWDVAMPRKSLTENLEILMKVCDAVAFAHSRGVVHRDLKPENVMLGGFGEVLVMDWGIALSTDSAARTATIRQSATMGGTPAYMAPEMATGPLEKIGVPSDIYLLAGILFEIVTGKTPHTGKSVMACLYAAAANEIQPTDATGELVEIALSAMCTDPNDRFQSVEEFQAAIRAYQSHSESIALCERAKADLQQAVREASYERFARALFAYEEAVALWPRNGPAQDGIVQARRAYAEAALRNDDYELGLSLVGADDGNYADVHSALIAGQREQQQRQNRIRVLKRVAAGLVVVLLISGTISYVRIEQGKAELAQQKEVFDRDLEEREQEFQDGLTQQKSAFDLDLEQQLSEFDTERDAFEAYKETSEVELTSEQMKADRAQEDADVAQYIADIGLAAAQIEANSFQSAEDLIQQHQHTGRENLEWGRLNFLSTGTYIEAGDVVRHVQLLDDGSAVIASQNGRLDRCTMPTAADPAPALWDRLPAGIGSVAVSQDGGMIAYAREGQGRDIVLVAHGAADQAKTLTGHTAQVTGLVFCRDGSALLSTSTDGTAWLWDVATAAPIIAEPTKRHSSQVWRGVFAPNCPTPVRVRASLGSADADQGASATSVPACFATAGQDRRVIVWYQDLEPHVFYKHQRPVYAVAFSPDGEWVASGDAAGRIFVWKHSETLTYHEHAQGDADEIEAIELTGHRGAIRSLAFINAPDHTHVLVSGSDDNTLCLWDTRESAAADRLIARLRGHSRAVTTCAIARGGQALLSGSDDGRTRVWDIGRFLGPRVSGHTDEIWAAQLAEVGAERPYVVTAGRDHTARVRTPDGTVAVLQEGHEVLASNVSAIPGLADHLVTSGGDNTTRVWSLTAGQLFVLPKTGRYAPLAVSTDGQFVLTGAQAGDAEETPVCAQVWRIKNGDSLIAPAASTDMKPERALRSRNLRQVTAVAIRPDNQAFFAGDLTGGAELWLSDESESREIDFEFTKRITGAAFLPDERLLIAAGDLTVIQWDYRRGTERADLRLNPDGWVTNLSVAAGGQLALTTSMTVVPNAATDKSVSRYTVQLWNLDTARELWRSEEYESEVPVLARFALQGNRFFVGNIPDNSSALGSGATGKRLFRAYQVEETGVRVAGLDVVVEGENVWSAAFGDAGNGGLNEDLVTLSGDALQHWSFATGEPLSSPLRKQSVVSSVAVSPDAKFVVTASWDLALRVWDRETKEVLHRLMDGSEGATFSVAYSKDGRFLAAAGAYGLTLWDGASFERLNVNTDQWPQAASHIAISADSRHIAAACKHDNGSDFSIRVWSVSPDLKHAEFLNEVPCPDGVPLCCALGPFGTKLAIGTSERGYVWRFDAPMGAAGVQTLELNGHTAAVTSVAFSPDGRRVVTGSEDTSAKIWDVEHWTGREAKQMLSLDQHRDAVTAVDVSTDGRFILTASRDGTINLLESSSIAPRVRHSRSHWDYMAGSGDLRIDPDATVNAPNSPSFAASELIVEIAPLGAGNADPGLMSLALANRQNLPVESGGDGSLSDREENSSEGQIEVDDAPVKSVVARVAGDGSSRLTISFTSEARLPDVEDIVRHIVFRAGAAVVNTVEVMVNYHFASDQGQQQPPSTVTIHVHPKATEDLATRGTEGPQ